MFKSIFRAIAASVITLLICSAAYPATVWFLARVVCPRQAEGSLIYGRDRSVIGSELIARPFKGAGYFQPRPSAVDYKADAAGGSNLGSNNPDLRAKVKERLAALGASDESPAPIDLVTASGSGLDPHIGVEAAYYQAPRIAAERKKPVAEIKALIDRSIDRSGEIWGARPRVNVLMLNIELDQVSHTR